MMLSQADILNEIKNLSKEEQKIVFDFIMQIQKIKNIKNIEKLKNSDKEICKNIYEIYNSVTQIS